jgi:hypothetical protein
MRGPGGLVHRRRVRVLLDIWRDRDGRVVGHVTASGGEPDGFSGWLELLHLLEDHADGTIPQHEGSDT